MTEDSMRFLGTALWLQRLGFALPEAAVLAAGPEKAQPAGQTLLPLD